MISLRMEKGAALAGLVARGVLYGLLAILSLDLVVGRPDEQADTRGALQALAQHSFGKALLVALVIGFGAFALWHAYQALATGAHHDGAQRAADGVRAFVYGALCALTITFILSEPSTRDSDQTERAWTARLMDVSAGRLLVGALGVAIVAAGVFLVGRALSGGARDEQSVLEATPRETPALRSLGAVGNVARGAIVVLVGVFLVRAAIDHNPGESAGLDDALKRVLDAPAGELLVVLVALGLAAFGVYSIARAWVNRQHQHAATSA
jgi:hypothetical protein